MHKGSYELNVLVGGKPLREYFHKDGRFYFEARNNSEYSIRLKNHSHKKIMAIFSVDGIETIKGKNAIDGESGYIINPYSYLEVKGYRIDENNIAKFRFTDGKTSYSTEVENNFEPEKLAKVEAGLAAPSKNNGVIGVRIWEEKEPMVIPEWKQEEKYKFTFYGNYNSEDVINLYACSGSMITGCCYGTLYYSGMGSGSMQPVISGSIVPIVGQGEFIISRQSVNQMGNLCKLKSLDICDSYVPDTISYSKSISNYVPNFSLGTTWGQKEEDKVIKVKFNRTETFIDLELYYLEREELVKMGIDLDNSKKIFVSGFPRAFDRTEEYCKEPINWMKR